ncbi:MAG: glycosyltransferase family 4 protein [Terracidiphilus sp.]|jgi:glycosyltransferase involved in cell wall biosynthesis
MKQDRNILKDQTGVQDPVGGPVSEVHGSGAEIAVSLLTGGGDRPYVFGLATSLISKGIALELIGSDELDFPQFRVQPNLTFLNLRGSLRPDVSVLRKIFRVLMYYARLIRYVSFARPKLFHILWNNKFEFFDRTLLMLYYRFLGKNTVLTVHNVNAGTRDLQDSFLNRLTLRIQYRLSQHIFVHTEKMKRELIEQFGVNGARVSVIPFGINNAIPHTTLAPDEAKKALGLQASTKTLLFFGNITPYKGLEHLVVAFQRLLGKHGDYSLIIAGKPDNCSEYWAPIREAIDEDVKRGSIVVRAEHIPDEEAEVYFKAADVLILPYRHVYQSGVLFTGYNFGLPVLAADVGSLKDEIVEGKTGFLFKAENSGDLAKVIEQYFASDLYADLNNRRQEIIAYAREGHSWDMVGQMTVSAYVGLLQLPDLGKSLNRDVSSTSLDVKTP